MQFYHVSCIMSHALAAIAAHAGRTTTTVNLTPDLWPFSELQVQLTTHGGCLFSFFFAFQLKLHATNALDGSFKDNIR